MRIFNKNKPKDVLFLMPVHLDGEKLTKSKIRMMYCDPAGKVYTTLISRSEYQAAREIADEMETSQKSFAIIAHETSKGGLLPIAVDINSEEEQALEYILEHALRSGKIPDILKKYIKPIIKRGKENKA